MSQSQSIAALKADSGLPVMERERIDSMLVSDSEEEAHSLVAELYALFKEESDAKIEQLGLACRENDVSAVRGIVHFIAGSAGNLGLVRLANYYRTIERAIDAGGVEDVSAGERPIRDEYVAACEAFEREFRL